MKGRMIRQHEIGEAEIASFGVVLKKIDSYFRNM
jgi:hypothetical protein